MRTLILAMIMCSVTSIEVAVSECPRCPHCDRASMSFMFRMRYCKFTLQKAAPLSNEEFRHSAAVQVQQLLSKVLDQDHIMPLITDVVLRKIANPSSPLVLHFAGDHGVGKTHTANLISLATSLWCKTSNGCETGDNLLIIGGSSFQGIEPVAARQYITSVLARHAATYPNGIVLVNDLSAVDPEIAKIFIPLFGREDSYLEIPEVNLRLFTVIVTTDLGKGGRSRGKSIDELNAMVTAEFRSQYSGMAGSMLRTFNFLPVSISGASSICEHSCSQIADAPDIETIAAV